MTLTEVVARHAALSDELADLETSLANAFSMHHVAAWDTTFLDTSWWRAEGVVWSTLPGTTERFWLGQEHHVRCAEGLVLVHATFCGETHGQVLRADKERQPRRARRSARARRSSPASPTKSGRC